ncbi:MAG: tetratricopeptide repeat protein, partial [Bacteroidota bacterium]
MSSQLAFPTQESKYSKAIKPMYHIVVKMFGIRKKFEMTAFNFHLTLHFIKKVALPFVFLCTLFINAQGQENADDNRNKRFVRHQRKIDSLNQIFQQEEVDTSRVNLLIQLGKYYRFSERVDTSQVLYERALESSKEINYYNGIIKTEMDLALVKHRQDDPDAAKELYRDIIARARAKGDKTNEIDAFLGMGSMLSRNREYDSSNWYSERALEIALEVGDSYRATKLYINLGTNKFITQEFEEALSYYSRGMESSKALEGQDGYRLIRLVILGNTGNMYRTMEIYDKAIDYYKEAIKEFEKTGDNGRLAIMYSNMGLAHKSLDQYEEAITSFEKCINYRKKMNTDEGVLLELVRLAEVYIEMADYNRAESILEEGKKYTEALVNSRTYVMTMFNRANAITQTALGNTSLGREYYNAALALYNQLDDEGGNVNETINAKWLYNYHKAKDDPNKALLHLEEYKYLEDSIYRKRNVDRVSNLLVKYRTTEKEKEVEVLKRREAEKDLVIANSRSIQIIYIGGLVFLTLVAAFVYLQYRQKQRAALELTSKNEIIAEQNEKLKANELSLMESLQEKGMLLKEIHHRVKNNLQVISSLLAVQAKEYNHPAIEEFVSNGRSRVQAMALVHQFLYQ